MPTVTLHKDETGKLAGLTPRDEKGYAKFRARLAGMTAEDSLLFTWREPRSGPFHRRHFAILNALFEAQEQFEEADQLRKWLEVGAGYCKFVPGPKGKMVAMPDSIAYEKLDQADFEPIHEKCMTFVRSLYATRFLWPHLDDAEAVGMVEVVLRAFE